MGNSGSAPARNFPAFLYVKADRPGYYAGENVTGSVCLLVNESFPCSGLYLALKAEERAWTYRIRHKTEKHGDDTHHYKEYTDYRRRKVIFEVNKLIMQAFGGSSMLAVGQYEIPFQFTLPANVPGSFFEERRTNIEYPHDNDFYSEIVYSLNAYVDEGGKPLPFNQQITSKSFLKVATSDPGNYEPELVEQTRGVYKCCCFKQGEMYMKSYPEEAVYRPGDRIKLMLEIANRSPQNIQKLDIRLIRKLTLNVTQQGFPKRHPYQHSENLFEDLDTKGEEGYYEGSYGKRNEYITQTMCEMNFPGLGPWEEAVGENARAVYLDLFSNDNTKHFVTETDGDVIKCQYYIQVMADAENCCVTDVPLNINTHIIPNMETGLEAQCYAVAVPVAPQEGWTPQVQPEVKIVFA